MMKTHNRAFKFTWSDGRFVCPPVFPSSDIVPDPSFFLDRAQNVGELFDRCCFMFAEYSHKLSSWGHRFLPDDVERRNGDCREGKELKNILLSLAIWIHEAIQSEPDVLLLCQAQQVAFAWLADATAVIVQADLNKDRSPIQKRCDSLGERILKYSKEVRKALSFGTIDSRGLMRTYFNLLGDITAYQDRLRIAYRMALSVATVSPAVPECLHTSNLRLSRFARWLELCNRLVARVDVSRL